MPKAQPQGKVDEVKLESLTKSKLIDRVNELEAVIDRLSHSRREVKHDPRPNVRYKLIEAPPGFKMAPQVGQMLSALSKAAKRMKTAELTEPQVFEILEQAKQDGVLSTKQSAFRVFQYYRPRMKDEGVIVEHASVEEAADKAA